MKILIVDDDPDMRFLVSKLVAQRSSFEVIGQASNGAEAIHRVADLSFHFVIMDINMPVMDGVEATRHIRDKFPAVVVLAFTAGTMEQVDEMLAAGASGYVMKQNMSNELSYYLGAMPKSA